MFRDKPEAGNWKFQYSNDNGVRTGMKIMPAPWEGTVTVVEAAMRNGVILPLHLY